MTAVVDAEHEGNPGHAAGDHEPAKRLAPRRVHVGLPERGPAVLHRLENDDRLYGHREIESFMLK